MGSRKTTKAAVILQGARERLMKAEVVMDTAQSNLGVAQQVYGALALEYEALERAFAREPLAAKPKAPRAPRKPRSDRGTQRGLPKDTTVDVTNSDDQ